MLTRKDIEDNFSNVVDIGDGIIRAEDELPKVTYYNYIRLGDSSTGGSDLIMVTENIVDDNFAFSTLLGAPWVNAASKLEILPLKENKYGFCNLIIVPKDYHSYLKGRLDNERASLYLCLPAHKCEFSGDESVEDFYMLRREIIETLDWNRAITPKILLRFDNPKTRGGTNDDGAFVRYSTLLREIDNLDGVVAGFIEIINFRGAAFEILSPQPNQFVIILNRDDSSRETVSKEDLLAKLWGFLTE